MKKLNRLFMIAMFAFSAAVASLSLTQIAKANATPLDDGCGVSGADGFCHVLLTPNSNCIFCHWDQMCYDS